MVLKYKMKNAPVYYALVQVRFNPIVAMAKYIDDIQDSLRHQAYTLFERQEITHLQLAKMTGDTPVEPKVEQTVSWLMTTEGRGAGFILTTTSLTFHTTHYDTNEKFIPELLRGLKIINDVVKLEHISRLGLRYLNAILPKEDETVAQYLSSGLHGINFSAERSYSLNESVFQTECSPLLPKGTIIARVIQAKSALGYPPDIVPYGLIPMPRFDIKEAQSHGIIDIDHFVEGIMPLNFEKIEEQLKSLHAIIKLAFEATITDHAKRIWS